MGSERNRKTKICGRQKSTGHKGIGTGGPMDKIQGPQTETDTQPQIHGPSWKQGTDEGMTKTDRWKEKK